MKSNSICLILFIVISCTSIPDLSDEQKEKVYGKAVEILSVTPVEELFLSRVTWPKELNFITPKKVYMLDNGLYIQLHSFFVTESGLFVPRKGIKVTSGVDPKYLKISPHLELYFYEIEG